MLDFDAIAKTLVKAEKRARKWGAQDIDSFGSDAALQDALRGPFTPEEEEELDDALKRLAAAYLQSPPEGRASIRALFDRAEEVRSYLPGIGVRFAEQARAKSDEHLILLALALVSINDAKSDWRDVLTSISEIVEAARRAGIDPKPILDEVARISNANPKDPKYSARALLTSYSS